MTEDLMSLDIFEFEDPGTHTDPIMRLKAPWRLNASLVQDVDVVQLVDEAQIAADAAQTTGSAALTIANAASKTFTQSSAPGFGARPLAVTGDYWINTTDNTTWRAVGSEWVFTDSNFPADIDIMGYWPFDDVSAIPNDPAGVTYLQDAWATVDGWAGSFASVSVAGGWLIGTSTAANNWSVYKSLAFGSGRTVRIRFKQSVSGDVYVSGTVDGVGNTVFKSSIAVLANTWYTWDMYVSGNLTLIQLVSQVAVIGTVLTIDWIYLGTGAYLTPAIDASGGGKHLAVLGPTPVPGLSGNGLSFDGVNDYLKSTAVLASVPDVWHFHCSLPFGNAQVAGVQSFFNYKPNTSTNGFLMIYREASLDFLKLWYCDGSTMAKVNFNSFFTGFTSTRVDIDVSVNWLSGVVTAYRNGILFGTVTMTTPVKPTAGSYLYFGSFLENYNFLTGVMDELRLYGRALAASEIMALYQFRTKMAHVAPKYLGGFGFTDVPLGNEGDTCVLYSSSSSERGLFLRASGAWVKQTAPTTAMLSAAWPDISRACIKTADGGFVGNTTGAAYGTTADYVGTGVNVFDVLAVQTEFVNKLFARYIKIMESGSIRGGDRYDETGATIDGTKSGFFIGAGGACKVAGIEFEGSQGGGVQWGNPFVISAELAITTTYPALSAASQNLFVESDATNKNIRIFRWDGKALGTYGVLYPISTMGKPSLAVMSYINNKFKLAFYDDARGLLEVYSFDGVSVWSKISANFTISLIRPTMCALSSTDIAIIGYELISGYYYERIYRYRYDFINNTWSAVGTPYASGTPKSSLVNERFQLAAISSDRIVAGFSGSNNYYSMIWSNTYNTWLGGPGLTLSIAGEDGAIAAFNKTDLLTSHYINDYDIFRLTNNQYSLVIPSRASGGVSWHDNVMCVLGGNTFVHLIGGNIKVCQIPFAISSPWIAPFIA